MMARGEAGDESSVGLGIGEPARHAYEMVSGACSFREI
jgi:hypothetical protein